MIKYSYRKYPLRWWPDVTAIGGQLDRYMQVCPSRFNGKPHITRSVLRDGYKRALKELGMPSMRLHDVRQIISSILQDAEVPLETIAMVLGHTGRGIVTKRYAGHSPDVSYKAYMFFIDLITGVVNEDTKWHDYSDRPTVLVEP